MQDGRKISTEVEKVVHAVDPNFWVPAVGNGQLGELLKFIETHNLWSEIQAVLRKEE